MALDVSVHRLSTAEYDRMVAAGVLDGLKVELLDGLLVDVTPQGEEHHRLIQAVTAVFAARPRLLRVQGPLDVADGWVPEPDVALAERDPDPKRHPATAFIVVEVAISAHAQARRKAPVYARAGIPVYWIVDAPGHAIVEYTEPTADGYAAVTELRGDDVLDARVDGVPRTTVAELFAW